MAADLKDRKEDEAVTGKKKNDDDMASITIHPPVLTPGKTTGTAKQQQTRYLCQWGQAPATGEKGSASYECP
eukprot:evm.model.NODE_29381_length_24900_cov_25.352932.3